MGQFREKMYTVPYAFCYIYLVALKFYKLVKMLPVLHCLHFLSKAINL